MTVLYPAGRSVFQPANAMGFGSTSTAGRYGQVEYRRIGTTDRIARQTGLSAQLREQRCNPLVLIRSHFHRLTALSISGWN